MMKATKLLCATICALNFLSQICFAQASDKIYIDAVKTDDLMAKEGQKVVVYGNTKDSGKSGSGMNFVNFDGAEFYLVTFKSDLKGFKDGEPSDIFDEKRIAVEGVVSVYKGKPQIKLTDPDMVTILGEEDVFPPVAAAKKSMKKEKSTAEKKTAKPEKKIAEEPKKKPPVDPKKYFK